MAQWPRPGWEEVEPFPFVGARRPFAGPTRNERFVKLRYFRRPDADLAAVASFGPMSEGAPGQAHGGAILTALDEALGAAAWDKGHRVLTVRLSTDFRKSVPVGAELLIETSIGRLRHRMLSVKGRLLDDEGLVYASAEGKFLELDEQARRRLLRS